MPRKFAWNKVKSTDLSVCELRVSVRFGPDRYVEKSQATRCIGIYTVEASQSLDIIGRINPILIYTDELSFAVGDGTGGNYPLCGPITENLGYEAVIAWRRTHEPEQFDRERGRARERFELLEVRRLAEQSRLRRKPDSE